MQKALVEFEIIDTTMTEVRSRERLQFPVDIGVESCRELVGGWEGR